MAGPATGPDFTRYAPVFSTAVENRPRRSVRTRPAGRQPFRVRRCTTSRLERGAGLTAPLICGRGTTDAEARLGLRTRDVDTFVKNAQVSYRPSRARICGPVRSSVPREPYTRARTMRGELPRLRTVTLRNVPGEPSLAPSWPVVKRNLQRCLGEMSS